MSSFFKTVEEMRISATNLAQLPEDNLVAEIFMRVYKNFSSNVSEFTRLPREITPEMLEACFVRTFGTAIMPSVVTELKRLSSQARRWFEKGGSGEDYARIFHEQLPLLQRTAQMVSYGVPATENSNQVALLAFALLQSSANTERFIQQSVHRSKEPTRTTVEV